MSTPAITPVIPPEFPKEITKTIVFTVSNADDEAFVSEEDFKIEVSMFCSELGLTFISLT